MKKLILLVWCLVLLSFANTASAAILYWDNNGTGSPTSGTWNTTSSQWATSNTLTTATVVWNSADGAQFTAGTANYGTINITVNSAITVGGILNGTGIPDGCVLTISGTGSLNFTGLSGIISVGSDGDPTTIAVPITGSGTIVPEGTDQLYLKANNTFTGGTDLGWSGGSLASIVNFTNASFGTGPIVISNCTGSALVALGTSAFTVPNPVTVNAMSPNMNLNIVGTGPGVTFSGNWSLGTNIAVIGSSGTSSLDIISGVISGSSGAGFTAWSTAGGTIEFNNAMTYNGPTVVSNVVVLTLGPNGSIGNSTVTVQTNATLADTNTSGSRSVGGSLTFQAASGSLPAGKALFCASGSSAGQITVAGNLTLNTTPITIHVSGTALTGGSYRLLSCSGSVSGSAATSPTITGIALPNGYTASISTTAGSGGHVDLIVAIPPAISSITPTNIIIAQGATDIITVSASGSQLTYQWQLNGGPLTGDVVGSTTSSSLTIRPVGISDAGSYTVTVSNAAGNPSATSTLTVVAPPAFSGTPGSGQFTLNYAGPVGKSYRIWSSTDPTLPVTSGWTLVQFPTQFQSGLNTFTDTAADDTQEYYTITIP